MTLGKLDYSLRFLPLYGSLAGTVVLTLEKTVASKQDFARRGVR